VQPAWTGGPSNYKLLAPKKPTNGFEANKEQVNKSLKK